MRTTTDAVAKRAIDREGPAIRRERVRKRNMVRCLLENANVVPARGRARL
jgi:hypothetical protein